MIRDPNRVASLTRFLSRVNQIRDDWFGSGEWVDDPWFRGHRDATWKLIPKVYGFVDADEDEIRSEFKRRASQLIGQEKLPDPHDNWAWYFLMQHYGAPTRLLDWTDGALLALHFALRHSRADVDAAVWLLDPIWVNERAIGRAQVILTDYPPGVAAKYLPRTYSRQTIRSNWPAAIDPPHVARRVAVQHSRFTIHGNYRDGLDRLSGRRGSRVVKITIGKNGIGQMKRDLATCGVAETTLFPDLEGLCRELEQDYCGDPISRS
jgi:hypothetical protein